MERIYTLCIVEKEDKIFLAKKKKKIGKGLWNGYGGKMEAEDANVEDAARRELQQECGLTAIHLDLRGIVDFQNVDELVRMHIFRTQAAGTAHETAEMGPPKLFDRDDLPFDQMLEADRIWLPYYLKGVLFKGRFHYDAQFNLLNGKVEQVAML